MTAVLGIDIAKDSFDVRLVEAEGRRRTRQFATTPAGHQHLLHWLHQHTGDAVHACMESTSVYWEDLALALHQAGHTVSVVNPARIKGYAQSQMRRSKTDPLDAAVIADFCRTQHPTAWRPPTEAHQKLRALVRQLASLKKTRTQQRNRLGTCRDEEVRQSLTRILEVVTDEIARVEQLLERCFEEHPDLKAKRRLLRSIKGIGPTTATLLLAEMYDLEHYSSAKAAAADAGVTASHYRSGTSVRRRAKMSHMGKGAVRGGLYMPTVTAMEHNPVIKAFAARLARKGKAKGVILVAAMRKLLHLAYGVLKHQRPFDPHYAGARG